MILIKNLNLFNFHLLFPFFSSQNHKKKTLKKAPPNPQRKDFFEKIFFLKYNPKTNFIKEKLCFFLIFVNNFPP
jgi:hypothetical protein